MGAAPHHPVVDVLTADVSGVVELDGLQQVGDQQPVDDETGSVLGDDRGLPECLLDEGRDRGQDLVVGGDRRHQFDEALHGRRVEEVDAEHLLGAPGGHSEVDQWDRRRVRREDRVIGGDLVEAAEELELDRFVLDDGLDHHVTIVERVHTGGVAEEASGGVAILGTQAFAGDGLVHRSVDAPLRRLGRRSVGLDDDGVHAGLRTHLGDARTHRAAADDGNLGDFHCLLPGRGAAQGRGNVAVRRRCVGVRRVWSAVARHGSRVVIEAPLRGQP